MSHRLTPLLAGVLLATSLASSATDDPQPAPMPASLQQMLTQLHAEKYSSLTLEDEKGARMEPEAFVQAAKGGHSFNIKKSTVDGRDPEIVMRLIGKEQAAMAMNPPAKLKQGDGFPPFRLARLDGTAVDNSALAGRYTLVSFYFSTCAPCIKEVPELNALAKRRGDINVLAVTFDSPEESKRFVEERQLEWPVVPNARELINAAGVKAYPTLLLLDPQGKVVGASVGGKSQGGTIDAWVDRFAAPKA
jgi:peroxiredoxin